jgi:hypothetical protein
MENILWIIDIVDNTPTTPIFYHIDSVDMPRFVDPHKVVV